LPKLESIPTLTFDRCHHLASVVFGALINITNLGEAVFQDCIALKSITLPDKLEVVERITFGSCSALKRVVCNKNLKTIGMGAFAKCSKLEDVQLASRSISFVHSPFARCDRLIELAAATGFPSNKFDLQLNTGE